jgi:hypothetical protein
MSQAGESARSRVSVDQCVSAVRAVEVPGLVCLRSSYIHVTEVGGTYGMLRLALKVLCKLGGLCGLTSAKTNVLCVLRLHRKCLRPCKVPNNVRTRQRLLKLVGGAIICTNIWHSLEKHDIQCIQ